MWLMLQVFVDDSGRGENQDNPIFVLRRICRNCAELGSR